MMLKIYTKYLFVFLLLWFPGMLLAQMDTAYFYTYGGYSYDHCRDIIPATNGGNIIVGTTSSFGNGNSDIYLFKIDSTFNYEWSKTYGGANVEWGHSIKPTFDNGYIIAGYTNSYGAGGYDVYLLKTDSAGELLWSKTYGGPDWDFGYSVQQTPDSGFVICGETYSYGNGNADVYVIRTNKMGDTLWTKTVGGIEKDAAYSIIVANDSNYVMVGETSSFGSGNEDVYMVKLDQSGDTLWTQTFGDVGIDLAYDVLQTSSNEYVFSGASDRYSFTNLDFILTKTDSIGNPLWERLYGGGTTDADEARKVCQLSTGGFAYIGYTKSFGFGEKDFQVNITDQDGLYISGALYGGFYDDEAFAFHVANDGKYVLAGTTESIGAGATDVLIVQVDTVNSSYAAVITNFTDNLPSLGVEQKFSEEDKINIYPNPFKESTLITFSSKVSNRSNFRLSIYDLVGKEVFIEENIKSNPYRLDRGTLNPGIYFYILFENNMPLSNGKLILN